MDTISDYLAFSQIPESGPINASLYITGLSLSNNNISSYISWMFVRVLSNLCGSAAHLFEDSTIFNKLHCPPTHSFVRNYFSSKHIVLNSKQFCFCVVIEEYQNFWHNLNKVALIWFGVFEYVKHMSHIPKFWEKIIWFSHSIPCLIWCHFNRFDGALFSVKAVVTNA